MIDANKLIEYIEDAGYEARSYTGRGMGSKECVGITHDESAVKVICDIIHAAVNYQDDDSLETVQDLCESLRNASEDSMGLSSIVYWPRITWPVDKFVPDVDEDETKECGACGASGYTLCNPACPMSIESMKDNP